MFSHRTAACALVVLSLMCIAAGDASRAARRVFRNDDFQTDLPAAPKGGGGGGGSATSAPAGSGGSAPKPGRAAPSGCMGSPGQPASGSTSGKGSTSGSTDGQRQANPSHKKRSKPRVSPAVGEVARVVLIALIVVSALLLLVWLVRNLRRRDGDVELEPLEPADETKGDGELIDALRARTGDRSPASLAAEGRFEEAVHAMLLGALEALVDSTPRLRKPSLTSREILAAVPDETLRADLEPLIRGVEACIFALRPADRDLYEQLRDHYEAFRTHVRAGGPT